MIYDQLRRVNQIDSEISDLHKHLGELYKERQTIIAPTSSPRKAKVTNLNDPQQLYRTLQIQWQHREVKLPAFSRLKGRLAIALEITAEVEQATPEVAGRVTVVVVPPFKTLQKSLQIAEERNAMPQVSFSEDQPHEYKITTEWEVLVIIDADQPVEGSEIAEMNYKYQGYDCSALGLQALFAYGLQTGNWPTRQEWTVLLPDIRGNSVLCVMQRDGELLIDTDDVDYLLGDNVIKPAILIKKGQSNA